MTPDEQRLFDERGERLAEYRDRIAELEASISRSEQCTGRLREIAHARGWNGVENSKILDVFIEQYIAELEADHERLNRLEAFPNRISLSFSLTEPKTEGVPSLRSQIDYFLEKAKDVKP